MRIAIFLTLSTVILSVGGCVAPIATPSLAPRAVEKQPIAMPESASREAISQADTMLISRIGSITARAEAGLRSFESQRTATEQAITHAAGSPPGSESWVAAQQALTALEAARAATRDAAADLDALRQEPANAAPGNRAAIEEASARLAQIDDAQSTALASLARQLG